MVFSCDAEHFSTLYRIDADKLWKVLAGINNHNVSSGAVSWRFLRSNLNSARYGKEETLTGVRVGITQSKYHHANALLPLYPQAAYPSGNGLSCRIFGGPSRPGMRNMSSFRLAQRRPQCEPSKR